ncbi:MAG: hypothetical protein MN733_20085, partial [Nitrososphaera sp.]|nr:hypothetical protein [Nitrososphaera sp.]
ARHWGDEQKILAYVWEFPAGVVKKGVGEGTAKLTFTAPDGNIFTALTPIELHQLAGDDIVQEYENIYQRSATNVDRTSVEDNFKLSLRRVGQYAHLAAGTSGAATTHFRADFEITSLSSEKEPLPVRFYIVDDRDNQYNEVAFNGTMQTGGDIDPHSSISGFKLFENVKEDASWIKIVIVGLNALDKVLELHVDLK